jgi:hypothetical protein
VLVGVLGNKEKAAMGHWGALEVSASNPEGTFLEVESKVIDFAARLAERCGKLYERLG